MRVKPHVRIDGDECNLIIKWQIMMTCWLFLWFNLMGMAVIIIKQQLCGMVDLCQILC